MQNLLDPAILFFVVGAFAGAIRSNLEIPPAISRFLSLYLLMALGLKGGFALSQSGLTDEVVRSLGCAVLLAVLVPLVGYTILRRFLPGFDAAALAATYGSVSAVTFITAVQYLDRHELAFGGHMAAAMALMESPAIVIAIVLANSLRQRVPAAGGVLVTSGGAAALAGPGGGHGGVSLRKVLHESFTDGAQIVLLGAMLIGAITGEAGKEALHPFTADLFKGMLALFLLDMGLLAARNMPRLSEVSPALIVYAVLGPITHAGAALGLAMLSGLGAGNGALLMVLAASASYIAVPAVVRFAIPEARPSLYFGMALGITFPLNLVFGIPAYVSVAQRFLASS